MTVRILSPILFCFLLISCGNSQNFNAQKYTKLKPLESSKEKIDDNSSQGLIPSEEGTDFEENQDSDQVELQITTADNDILVNSQHQPHLTHKGTVLDYNTEVSDDLEPIASTKIFDDSEENNTKITNDLTIPEKVGKLSKTGTLTLWGFISFLFAFVGVSLCVLYGTFVGGLIIGLLGGVLLIVGTIAMYYFLVKALKNEREVKSKSENRKSKTGAILAKILAWFLIILMIPSAIIGLYGLIARVIMDLC